MQDIIKEYGPALITIVAIVALVVVIRSLIGTDASDGIVGQAFNALITDFFKNTTETTINTGASAGLILF